jgi:DNA replication and repair protein RecF
LIKPSDVAPVPPLAVSRLTVTEFRCYAAARIEADARPVVLTGPNGAGKTNLLEAVSFLAPGRGLRRARLDEVLRRRMAPHRMAPGTTHGMAAGDLASGPTADDDPETVAGAAPGVTWAVAALLDTPRGPVAIGTGPDPQAPGRRVVRIDGRPAASQTALADHVIVAWLTPQMDRLFIEGAGNRRRFLDRLVFGFYPDHAGHLSAYDQAMRERARLLREDRLESRRDEAWLAALEDIMATNGVAAAAARRDAARRLNAAVAVAPDGPFPRAGIAIAGTVEDWLAEMPALAAEDRLRARLRQTRALDAAAGGAAEGPHRSDLAVRHVGKDMPAGQCSTGEQKALLIGLVLANARLLAAERGVPPLLLLDEVAAHLDGRRRAALFEEILALGAQAWLTGTDESLFAPFGDRARFFGVEDAVVTERRHQ